MEIVDALHKLSFSFWQVVVLILVFLFRGEFKELLLRISTIKVANNEIHWGPNGQGVAELTALKSEIDKGGSSEKQIVGLIESKIKNRLVVALSNIKRGTTYLWPALVSAKPGSGISVAIRQETIDRIASDLSTLRGAGVFDYELGNNEHSRSSIRQLVVRVIPDELLNLITEVERNY